MINFEAVCSQGHPSKCVTTNADGQKKIYVHNRSLDHAREQRKLLNAADHTPFSRQKAKEDMPDIPLECITARSSSS